MVTRRFVVRSLGAAALIAALSAPLIGRADTRAALEYQVKAAFLYNFAKFVEWPAESLPQDTDAVTIGVIGEDPFGAILEDTLDGKTCCHDRRLVARRFRRVEDAASAQILFIGASEESHLPEILSALDGANVLTVSDIDRFADRGGVIGFRREGNKLRFEINTDAAAHAGLTISSQLLKLATRVINRADAGS